MLFISGGKLSYDPDSANCCIAAIYKIAFLICIQCMPVGLFFVQRRSYLAVNSSNAMRGWPRMVGGACAIAKIGVTIECKANHFDIGLTLLE